jgi:RloB-like protein
MAGKQRRAGSRPLKRKVAIRKPRKTLVVFCEGEKTEPQYLGGLKRLPWVRDVAAVDIRIETGHGGSVPRTLVSLAADARTRAIDEEGEIDEFWCVFDVEWPKNHPSLSEAIRQAHDNDIKLAVSNPCFELWLILHFQDHTSWLDNTGARRLRERLDGAPDKSLAPARYMPRVTDAARRAAALDVRHQKDGAKFPQDNPSSGMHFLVASVKPTESIILPDGG